jgi:hypothetical protein
MDNNFKKIRFRDKFLALIYALKHRNTLKVLIYLFKELPKLRKNIKRIKKYGIKHIYSHFRYKILIPGIKKDYMSKNNIIKEIDHRNRFKKITIDTTFFNSELCEIGKRYNSDKSPHMPDKHRHAYTGIYHLLFHGIKNNNLNFAEIGIYKNQGMKMFRDYFKNANLYGFEKMQNLIDDAKKDNLYNTKYFQMDVNSSLSIKKGFENCSNKFDIIIDDSSHMFDHQINIISTVYPYLKRGGYLIIEDIFNNIKIYDEKNYYNKLDGVKKNFSEIYFIQSEHINRWSPMYDNDKLLVLIKS